MISVAHALVLGVVEGLTEFLPVSSTGHLILASYALGLSGEAVKTFEVVIQVGAIAAVFALYRARAAAMARGALGRDPAGLRLLARLLVSFLPAAVMGVLLHEPIKRRLFGIWPVVGALALGGVAMILIDRRLRRYPRLTVKTLESLSMRDALVIGLVQCLALWPGTSRSMVTILAGILLGLPATAAAEYTFLLALPTLGAAAAFDALKGGSELLAQAGAPAIAVGFAAAAVTAALAIRGFVQYLSRRGLAPFGWYRLGLAVVVAVLLSGSG